VRAVAPDRGDRLRQRLAVGFIVKPWLEQRARLAQRRAEIVPAASRGAGQNGARHDDHEGARIDQGADTIRH
jgi:hypothetical protein